MTDQKPEKENSNREAWQLMPNKIQAVAVPIEWDVSDSIVARYATNMIVQKLENEFLISFFEIKPPIILGELDNISEKLNEMKSIRANCVAQIIISEDKMPAIIRALETNLKRSASVEDTDGNVEAK